MPEVQKRGGTNRRHYWKLQLLRTIPRRRHLRGGPLHGLLGERLFDRELWAFSRKSLAGGLAVGLFIGLTPTMGVQALLSVAVALLLRINVPVALAATLVTNPLTAPFIYAMEYQVGTWLLGAPHPADVQGYTGMLRSFVSLARPLWAGSLLLATPIALAVYGLVNLLWPQGLRKA